MPRARTIDDPFAPEDPSQPLDPDPATSRQALLNGIGGMHTNESGFEGAPGSADIPGPDGSGGLTGKLPPVVPEAGTSLIDRAGQTPGQAPSALDVTGTVNNWMTTENPYHHQDASYWIDKINNANGGPTQANIDYFKGRFLEDPNNNPHSPQNQPGYVAPGGSGGTTTQTSTQSPGLLAPTAPLAMPTTPAATPESAAQNPQTDFNQQMRNLLMSQLQGLSTPTSADSPDIAPAISAYNVQSQRDQQAERDAIAERFYASGEGGGDLKSGGFDTAVTRGREEAAGKRANFTGSMVWQAANAKRTQLQQMLQTATSAGLTDQAQRIQQQIAQIDADLRRQGLTQQNSQFTAQLGQQDRQFNDRLGYDYTDLTSRMNRDALLAAMNG